MIEVSKLRFGYGKSLLYEDFSLTITQPGIYGLFGRNGSGKSTLLKLLAGLLFPQSGSVSVLGFHPRQRKPSFLEQVYVVPEEFHLPDMNTAGLLRSHASSYPHFSGSAFTRYAEEFEIPSVLSFSRMSLGQKKKAAIAFALAARTPVLLMDEPTNGLDILGRSQFKRIMAEPEHAKRVVVISTHQAHDLENLMEHVLFVDSGRLALSANMTQLRRALSMGVVDNPDTLADFIYREPLGTQCAFVSANTHNTEPGTVHLELLYKALTANKSGVLAALDVITANPKEHHG